MNSLSIFTAIQAYLTNYQYQTNGKYTCMDFNKPEIFYAKNIINKIISIINLLVSDNTDF